MSMSTNNNANAIVKKQDFIRKSEISIIAKKIKKEMEEEKIFTHFGLTVRDLADAIGEKPYLISKSINQVYKKSFIQLVNEYRVKEVICLMNTSMGQTHSLLGMAFESGFNSKTSFHIQFKKITGYTPKEYKNGILLEQNRNRFKELYC